MPTELFFVNIQSREWKFDVPHDMSVLEAAVFSGFSLPSSCRNGTCRTCMCRMINGRISYRIAWPGLSAEEKKDGFILPCVAYPESNLVIDVPAAAKLSLSRT